MDYSCWTVGYVLGEILCLAVCPTGGKVGSDMQHELGTMHCDTADWCTPGIMEWIHNYPKHPRHGNGCRLFWWPSASYHRHCCGSGGIMTTDLDTDSSICFGEWLCVIDHCFYYRCQVYPLFPFLLPEGRLDKWEKGIYRFGGFNSITDLFIATWVLTKGF